MESAPFWMWIVGFLLVLGPLVTIHEFGHYLVARWFGVKADVFSIGFGRELTGWTDRRGTRWRLSALPLGGYVQFAGDMNPASQPSEEWLALPEEERRKTFQAKPLWQRALIVAEKADDACRRQPVEMAHRPRIDQAIDRLVAGHDGAEQDDQHDDDARKVLDAPETVGESLRRLASRQDERDP